MIEVYKTDIKLDTDVSLITKILNRKYPNLKIDFDLEDCDNILRIEGIDFCSENIMNIVVETGFCIEILPE